MSVTQLSTSISWPTLAHEGSTLQESDGKPSVQNIVQLGKNPSPTPSKNQSFVADSIAEKSTILPTGAEEQPGPKSLTFAALTKSHRPDMNASKQF